MGNSNKKDKNKKHVQKLEDNLEIIHHSNYHCSICNEIPFLYFNKYNFNITCSTHKIDNIPYDQFYKYISFKEQCYICKSFNANSYIFCNECNKIYCIQCMEKFKICSNKGNITINAINMNTICKKHQKNYNKFCLNCKENLCEQCQNHDEHYIEFINDIYPTEDEVKEFKSIIEASLEEKKKDDKKNTNFEKNEEKILEDLQELKGNKIKKQIVNSFSKDITNYIYIINVSNIIKCFVNNTTETTKKDIIKEDNIEIKLNKNNIENKILIKALSQNNREDKISSVWCMLKLNDIKITPNKKLELIAIGGSGCKIIIFNILKFQMYQILNQHTRTVYSLDQYKDDPNYLFSSSNDNTINIYKLNNNNNKYELIQTLKKEANKAGGEINKVIVLSNKLLASGDHRSITIWKSKIEKKDKLIYEDFYEIIINKDTCHLLEVNPFIFVATQYSGNHFQVYKNDNNTFPLIGELTHIETHGSSSNGLAKINDNIVCSSGNNYISIMSIEPLQLIQKIFIDTVSTMYYIYITKSNYLYTRGNKCIMQYKIINDEDNNFIELIELGKFNKYNFNNYQKAIISFDDGRIFYNNYDDYYLIA